MDKFNKQEFFKQTLKYKSNIEKLSRIIEFKEKLELELNKTSNKQEILEKINILDKNFTLLYNENEKIKKLLK